MHGFPSGSTLKNPPANVGDARDEGSIPESGRSPGEEITATHSSILARKSHRQMGLAGYSPWGRKRLTTWLSNWTTIDTHTGITILWLKSGNTLWIAAMSVSWCCYKYTILIYVLFILYINIPLLKILTQGEEGWKFRRPVCTVLCNSYESIIIL